ncbi:hypothetical protein IFM89_014060, partial [Coptis chinensis]
QEFYLTKRRGSMDTKTERRIQITDCIYRPYELDIPVTYPATAPELSMEKLTRCIEEERFASQFILNHYGRKTGMWNVLFSNAI